MRAKMDTKEKKRVVVDPDVVPDTDLHPLSWQYLRLWVEYVMTPKELRSTMTFSQWLDNYETLERNDES